MAGKKREEPYADFANDWKHTVAAPYGTLVIDRSQVRHDCNECETYDMSDDEYWEHMEKVHGKYPHIYKRRSA